MSPAHKAVAVLTLLSWLAALTAARAEGLDRLVASYPDKLLRVEGNELVWRDGSRMPIRAPGPEKTDEQALHAGDIADMFRFPYSRAMPAGLPETDPGRIRNAAFFAKMYGDCRAGAVARDLVAVDWLPRHHGGRVMMTRINGVADRLRAVSEELDRLPEADMRFLKPSAGTYNCRAIAGTADPSAHGYGIAIDIAVAESDYWRWSRSGYRNRIPEAVVDVFERHGFIWGGKWRHFDTMHFEYRPELL